MVYVANSGERILERGVTVEEANDAVQDGRNESGGDNRAAAGEKKKSSGFASSPKQEVLIDPRGFEGIQGRIQVTILVR